MIRPIIPGIFILSRIIGAESIINKIRQKTATGLVKGKVNSSWM
jgi:hypothetical protein